MPDTPRLTRRHAALTLGAFAVGAWVYGAPRLAQFWPEPLGFRDLAGLAPFRELTGSGAITGTAGLFTALAPPTPDDADHTARKAAVRANPCLALFGQNSDARLPVALFSDFNCPNCRILETNLAAYQARNPDALRIIRFELPLLGAASTTASKAVLAADLQGAYAEMHERLRRNRMVTDKALLRAIAEDIGLDGARLLADMDRPKIDQALAQARAIAAVFGFYGTPSAVIGRTAFLGAVSTAQLTRIITAEQALPPLSCQTS